MNQKRLLVSTAGMLCILSFVAGCGGPSKQSSTATIEVPFSATPTHTIQPPTEIVAPSIANKKIPMIYDDDGSPDGTTAMFYLLSRPDVDVKVISLSYGEVYPDIYIQHLGRVIDSFGLSGILLGYGQKPDHSNYLDFPEFLRQSSNNFWGLVIPNANKIYPALDAVELFVSAIHMYPEPVTIFIAGPCTNFARALRLDPSIKDNISAVYIMGGAVYTPGNVHDFYPDHANVYAEWNFVADPQAAKEVFESGLEMYLIPLDATNQVLITPQDTSSWRTGGNIADRAADLYDLLFQAWGSTDAAIWDLMSAVVMLEPQLCKFEPLHLEVIAEEGNKLGQSAIIEGGEANISVCLEPNPEMIRQHLIEVFSSSP